MKRTILIFSGLTLALFALFRLSRYLLIIPQDPGISGQASEIFIIITAFLFIGVGIILSRLFRKPADLPTTGRRAIDKGKLQNTGLSK